MRYAKTLVCLFGFLVGASLTARADNTSCGGGIVLVPDGSALEGTFSAPAESRWFRFTAKVGRSYVIMVDNTSPEDTQSMVSIATLRHTSCAGPTPSSTDVASVET